MKIKIFKDGEEEYIRVSFWSMLKSWIFCWIAITVIISAVTIIISLIPLD